MPQKYALYFNRKALLFNNSQNIHKQANKNPLDAQTIKKRLKDALEIIQKNDNQGFTIDLSPISLDEVLPLLKNLYVFIQAAGGIVENQQGNLLFIYRLGCWDLPKGKVEKNENLETAASREITEETGLPHLQNQEYLTKTYHTYSQKGKDYLKETTWYRFNTDSEVELSPQGEEGITEAKWVSKDNIQGILQNTYPSIEDVINEYLK